MATMPNETTKLSDEHVAEAISACMIELNHYAILAAKRGLRVEYISSRTFEGVPMLLARVMRTF